MDLFAFAHTHTHTLLHSHSLSSLFHCFFKRQTRPFRTSLSPGLQGPLREKRLCAGICLGSTEKAEVRERRRNGQTRSWCEVSAGLALYSSPGLAWVQRSPIIKDAAGEKKEGKKERRKKDKENEKLGKQDRAR